MNTYIIIALCACASLVSAIGVDISLGDAVSFPSDLKVDRSFGGASESLSVGPKTSGFRNPQYYSLRFRHKYSKGGDSPKYIELELIHHKLYIDKGLPDYIHSLEFTDGYNLLMGNWVFGSDPVRYRVGIGALITHPDITIGGDGVGLSSSERIYTRGGGLVPLFSKASGYQLSGISFQFSSFVSRDITDKLTAVFELKAVPTLMTRATEFKYQDDSQEHQTLSVSISNFSIHFLAGISFGK